MADLQERAEAALEGIAAQHPGQRVLVVCHGGFLHAAYRRATGHTYNGKNINGALNFIKVEPARGPGQPASWAVVRWAVVDHLQDVGFLTTAFGGGSKSG